MIRKIALPLILVTVAILPAHAAIAGWWTSIAVVVHDSGGRGMPGVKVAAFELAEDGTTKVPLATLNTDQDGRLKFTQLKAQALYLEASLPGYLAVRVGPIPRGDVRDGKFLMPPGHTVLIVLPSGGYPA